MSKFRPAWLLTLTICLGGCPDSKPPAAPDTPTRAAPVKGAPDAPLGKKQNRPTHPDNPALEVTEISFAGPAGHRADASFARGEGILCLFTVSNFTYQQRKAHIRADIRVKGPRDQNVVLQPDLKLIQGKAPTLKPGTIRTAATLYITPAAPPGKYQVELTVRDVLGRRRGIGKSSFTIVGSPPTAVARLTLSSVRLAADASVPAGSVVPVMVEVAGFTTRRQQQRHLLDLAVTARLTDGTGKTVHRMPTETLVRQQYHFAPRSHPVEYMLPLPRALAAGRYQIVLEVADRVHGKARVEASLPLEVAPATTLTIYNLHAHDAARLPRSTFLLGEQIYIRLSVYGLQQKAKRVAAAVDLAVIGPYNDQHMARTDAARTSAKTAAVVARAGRYPVQLPLILPSLAPTGIYRLVLRARDLHGKKVVQRQLKLRLQGNAPKPFANLKVDDLEVRTRSDLPPLKGDTFGAGRSYELVLKLGGLKPEKLGNRRYRVRIKGGLTLRDLSGRVVHSQDQLFKLDRVMTYRPLRLLIPARWTAPGLPGGLYDLGVSAESLHDRRVSQLSRRVEIVAGR